MDVRIGTHWLQTTNILYSQLLYIQAASDLDMPLVRGGPGKKNTKHKHTYIFVVVGCRSASNSAKGRVCATLGPCCLGNRHWEIPPRDTESRTVL